MGLDDVTTIITVLDGASTPVLALCAWLLWKLDRRLLRLEFRVFGGSNPKTGEWKHPERFSS